MDPVRASVDAVKIGRALIVASLACMGTASLAGAQPATNAQQAKEHFKRGELLDHAHDYYAAIAEYAAAYAIAPHPDVLFNIAVDHEHLHHWQQAADMFQRYLDERDDVAADAAAVTERIRVLREKAPHHVRPDPTPPPPDPQPQPLPTVDVQPQPISQPPPPAPEPGPQVQLGNPSSPQLGATFSHWHVAGSYGIADGSAPSERYQARAGYNLLRYVDLDAVGGSFGNNDYALGGMLRISVGHGLPVQPFVVGAATIGIAKQDASSRAGTRFPVGFEAGGGVQFGNHGRVELAVVLRYLTGGWAMADTTAFSYANDTMAIGVDLGIAVDIPTSVGLR